MIGKNTCKPLCWCVELITFMIGRNIMKSLLLSSKIFALMGAALVAGGGMSVAFCDMHEGTGAMTGLQLPCYQYCGEQGGDSCIGPISDNCSLWLLSCHTRECDADCEDTPGLVCEWTYTPSNCIPSAYSCAKAYQLQCYLSMFGVCYCAPGGWKDCGLADWCHSG